MPILNIYIQYNIYMKIHQNFTSICHNLSKFK